MLDLSQKMRIGFDNDKYVKIQSKKIKERLSLVYSEKFVESNNSYSLYFGTPLFNTNGEFIGIISTRFRSDNFDKFLTFL